MTKKQMRSSRSRMQSRKRKHMAGSSDKRLFKKRMAKFVGASSATPRMRGTSGE